MLSLLIIAPGTAALIMDQGLSTKFSDTMTIDTIAPEAIIHQLTDYRNKGIDKALIVEKCISALEENWIWVGDAINRSGTNPLRGISGNWPDPFIDLTNLYHLPPGVPSSTVTCLGDRVISPALGEPCCAHLHSLAILAHRVNIAVSGILINPHSTVQFDPAGISF